MAETPGFELFTFGQWVNAVSVSLGVVWLYHLVFHSKKK